MIEAVTGYPGSGKSIFCANQVRKGLKEGRKVFINIPVKGAYQISFDDLVKYRFPKGSLVVIDEAGRWFSSRRWKDLPSEVFDLFTLHRHMKLDLLVAVQNFNRIDIALREVIEIVWWARNLPFVPVFIYDGYYDVEQLGLKGESQHKQYISKWTKARKLYDTHAMAKAFDEKEEIPLRPWFEEEKRLPWYRKLLRKKEAEGEGSPARRGVAAGFEEEGGEIDDAAARTVSVRNPIWGRLGNVRVGSIRFRKKAGE